MPRECRGMQRNARVTYGSVGKVPGEYRGISGERMGVGAKSLGNVGECRGMPGERMGVAAKCQGNAGECSGMPGERIGR